MAKDYRVARGRDVTADFRYRIGKGVSDSGERAVVIELIAGEKEQLFLLSPDGAREMAEWLVDEANRSDEAASG